MAVFSRVLVLQDKHRARFGFALISVFVAMTLLVVVESIAVYCSFSGPLFAACATLSDDWFCWSCRFSDKVCISNCRAAIERTKKVRLLLAAQKAARRLCSTCTDAIGKWFVKMRSR